MKTGKLIACLMVAILSGVGLYAAGNIEAPEAKRVVTTITRSSYASEEWFNKMNEAFTKETGIEVQVQVTPGTNDDHVSKVNIDLLAGSDVDVVPTLGPRDLQTRIDAGFFAALGPMTKAADLDVDSVWGKYLQRDAQGEFYSIPNKQEIYCLYYNKALFDKAGVPYPTSPWTWKDFDETTKKLTDAKQQTYGLLMRLETPSIIIQAMQKKVPLYKADGTSNFNDPAFAESLKWYYENGKIRKYQLDAKGLIAEKASWNYWATVDNMAMFIQGNWFMRLLNSQADYPHDWNYGVVAIPTSGTPESTNNFVSMSYASVNKNAAHPKEALEYAVWLGKNQWRFENGIPALVNLTPEQQQLVFKSTADASTGSITVEDLNHALIDNGLNVVDTDIVGPGAAQYTQIIKEEVERYCTDQQDLASTVTRIKNRADAVLKAL